MAAMTSFHTVGLLPLGEWNEASARRLCSSVRQFLIYSTFLLVMKISQYRSMDAPKTQDQNDSLILYQKALLTSLGRVSYRSNCAGYW